MLGKYIYIGVWVLAFVIAIGGMIVIAKELDKLDKEGGR